MKLYITQAIQKIFGWISPIFSRMFSFFNFIPQGWAIIYLIVVFVSELLKNGFVQAGYETVRSIVIAGVVINEQVTIAVETPELFGFSEMFTIVSSFFVFYTFYKIVKFALMNGANLNRENIVFPLIIFLLLYLYGQTSYLIGTGDINYVPVKDDLLYLIQNIKIVLILPFS